jgi:hypothetical protein
MDVLDLADMVASATVDINACGFGSLALSPNAELLAAVSQCGDYYFTNGLTFVDTTTAKVVRGFANFAGNVAYVSNDGNAYVLQSLELGAQTIDIVSSKTGEITTLATGSGINAFIVSPQLEEMYWLTLPGSTVQIP